MLGKNVRLFGIFQIYWIKDRATHQWQRHERLVKLLIFQTVANLNSWQLLWQWEWHWTAFVIIGMFLKSLGLILRQQCTFANDTLNVNAAKLKVLQKESKNCLDMICMQCIYITQLKLQDIRSKTPGAMK